MEKTEKRKIDLWVGKGSYTDVTELVQRVVVSGRKGAGPRTLQATLLDSEGYEHGRAPINCGKGQTCIFYENGVEIFRGLIMTDSSGNTRTLTIKAYDDLVYMTNNKDSFTFENASASGIFGNLCSRLGLKVGTCANTGYVIPELTKRGSTYWDVLEDALSQTYKATGVRYYVSASKGIVSLIRRTEESNVIVLEPDVNIAAYERTRSIYDTRTRITLYTSKNEKKSEYVNGSLESQIGVFREVDTVDSDVSTAEMNEIIQSFKEEKAKVQKTLRITDAIGYSPAVAGKAVYVRIPHINERRIMYIDEDTHTFENNSHKMTLKLNYAANINEAG